MFHVERIDRASAGGRSGPQRLLAILVSAALIAALAVVAAPGVAVADVELPDRELVIVVESVTALDDFGGAFNEAADFYGVVSVAGVELPASAVVDDDDSITPGWEFRTTVDRSIGSVPLKIRIFDEDGGLRASDDEADLVPGGGDRGLDLTLDTSACTFGGDATGACSVTATSSGDASDRATIGFRVELNERPVSADVSILVSSVRALDNFGTVVFPEAADFYGVVAIDGFELPETPVIDNDDSITPNWEFERLVDVSDTAVPIRIRIFDEDGALRAGDDQADLVPGGDRGIDITLNLVDCTFTGDLSGSCGDTITTAGTGDDSAEIVFTLDAVNPPAAEDLRVTCSHSPIWPQDGETVTITATLLDETLAPALADELEIHVDDRNTPAASDTFVSSTAHSFTASTGTFFYGCGGEQTGLGVFSGYRRVTVGVPAATGNAVPVYFTGEPDQRIDIVLAPDAGSFTGATDPAFQALFENWVTSELFASDVFVVNQDLFNLWVATDTGTAGGFTAMPRACNNTGPAGFGTTYGFAESVGILHTNTIRDCAQGRRFSAGTTSIIAHEMGHSPFGLADEYCCDGGYFQPPTFPNVYTTQAACQADAPNVGRTAASCRSWVSTVDMNTYWTSDPASGDLMVDNAAAQALDIRRIAWVLNDAARASGGPGGLSPAAAPVPPEPAGPTTKAYRVSATLDENDGIVDSSVELVRTYERYIGEGPEQLFVNLGSWTNNEVGSLAFDGVLRVHTWDSVTGAHGADEPVPDGVFEVVLPFSPSVSELVISDEEGSILGEIPLDAAVRVFCETNPSDRDCGEGYDLRVSEVSANAPELGIVGEPVVITVETTGTNDGPTSGVPATLEVRASSVGTVGVTPMEDTVSGVIDVGDPLLLTSQFTVDCVDGGDAAIAFDAALMPDTDERLELDLRNNVDEVSVDIECLLPIAINLRPGSVQNRVDAGNGRVEFAVLTTEAGEYGLPAPFDASWVDPDSIVVGPRDDVLVGEGASLSGSSSLRDMRERFDERTRDGDADLRAWFRAGDAGLASGATEVCVVGSYQRPDGTTGRFIGCDDAQVAGR